MIKGIKKCIVLVMVLLLTISSTCFNAYAANQYKGGIVVEGDTPKVVAEGLMPSTGDVKAAVLMVEFQDIKASISRDGASNTMFGENNSMRSYYKTSSYNKLNISGDVYDWYTAQNNRVYYEDNTKEYPPIECLFREVIGAMDSQVDFSQYDSDNDGYVDVVYMVYAGKDTGYQTQWWAYMKELISDVTVDGKKISQIIVMPEDFDYLTAAHETGHAMGLQDYYDAEQNMFGGHAYYGTDSLMCTSSGELDAFSKWMLGWLEPQIVSESKTISLRPSNEYPDAAVIKSNVIGAENVFFIAEYRTNTQNNKDLTDSGVSIFRVNAEIDSQTGAYKYDVSQDEVRLIEHVVIDAKEGYLMGTTQEPTSYIVQEEGGNIQYSPTGITVDNLSINSNVASMNVTFGDGTITGNIEYEKNNFMADSRIGYTLTFPVGVTYVGVDLTATDGIDEIPVKVSRDSYDDSLNKNRFYLYTTENLKPGTTYTIDLPEGAFMAFDGRISKAEKLQVTTSSYGEVKEYVKPFGNISMVSDSLPYGMGGFVYFTNEDGAIYMKTVDAAGVSQSKLVYDMGDLNSNGALYDSVVQACQLDDGSFVVTARDNTNNAILKLTTDGQMLYSNEIELGTEICLSPMGSTVVLGESSTGGLVALTSDNQIKNISAMDIHNPIMKLGENYALITGMNNALSIMDGNLNELKSISVSANGNILGADVVDGKIIIFESSYDSRKEIISLYSSTYDENGNLQEKGLIRQHSKHDVYYNKVYSCQYGYVFTGAVDLVIGTAGSNGKASPVANIMVTDKNCKVLYKCSFDYAGTGNGDSIDKVSELRNGTIVCNSSWCDYVLKAPTQAEQHTHSYGNDVTCDVCGYTLVANGGAGETPPSGETGGTGVTPPSGETGGTGEVQPFIAPDINVSYRTHIERVGWESWRSNGVMGGTSGRSLRLEGINVTVAPVVASEGLDLGIQYTTHCESYGWLPWSADGDMNGTEGESKRLESIKIQLTGEHAEYYDVYYRVHAEAYGWLGWAKDGEPAGTAGYSKRLEGVQIVVVKKDSDFDHNMGGINSKIVEAFVAKAGNSPIVNYPSTSNTNPVVPGADTPNVAYRTHVEKYGWQAWKYNGQMSGTSGESKRLEGIEIKLTNKDYEGGIAYTTHVEKYAWQGTDLGNPATWRQNGAMAGTSGESKRLEAICITLTGDMAEHYDIYYRVHAEAFGWLGWASNGAPAGTAGHSKRLEGIQIILVEKGEIPPTAYAGIISKDARAYIEK